MQLVIHNVAVSNRCRSKREDGANPSQPRYCVGYCASRFVGQKPCAFDNVVETAGVSTYTRKPSAAGGEGARERFEAEARKPAATKLHAVAVSAG